MDEITFGISPERLREICDAERDGRCKVMPCKILDTVYVPKYSLALRKKVVTEEIVMAIKVYRSGFGIESTRSGRMTSVTEWGVSSFPTSEQAEVALAQTGDFKR